MLRKEIDAPISPRFENAALDNFVRAQIKDVYLAKLDKLPKADRNMHCVMLKFRLTTPDLKMVCLIRGEIPGNQILYEIVRLKCSYLSISAAERTYEGLKFIPNKYFSILLKSPYEKAAVEAILAK